MTGLLELAIRVVALATRLPTITVRAVSPMTEPLTPVDKTTSSITKFLALVSVWHLWLPVVGATSLVIESPAPIAIEVSPATGLLALADRVESPNIGPLTSIME